jgi:hypothetical protein
MVKNQSETLGNINDPLPVGRNQQDDMEKKTPGGGTRTGRRPAPAPAQLLALTRAARADGGRARDISNGRRRRKARNEGV